MSDGDRRLVGSRQWLLWVGLLVLVGTIVILVVERNSPPSKGFRSELVVSGDTAGWLVPCGCTSNQSGGLPRRGTFVHSISREKMTTVYVADAGGAASGTSRYQKTKFEAILRGELTMGLVAHNLGASEVTLGGEYLRELAARLHVPFVSANVTDASGRPLAEPLRSLGSSDGMITGVLSPRYATEGVQIEDPRTAILRAIARGKEKCSVVVLAYMPEEELLQLAASLPEADVIVGGPTGQSISPRQVGPTQVASATNKGKFLVHFANYVGGARRLWEGNIVELNEKFGDDPDQQANVRQYLAELEKLDLPAGESGFVSLLPMPKEYRLAGNAACISCHKNDYDLWNASKHGHAWQTIKDKGYHVDSYCQQCHTTGYGLPGGFESISRSSTMTSVGCESCHGPSQLHVREPKTKTPFNAKDQCVRCHDHENSPKFEYESYWAKIKHGSVKP